MAPSELTLSSAVFLLMAAALIGPLVLVVLGYHGLARAQRLVGEHPAIRSFGVWNAWTMGLPTIGLYLEWARPGQTLPRRAAELVPHAMALAVILFASFVLSEGPPLAGSLLFVVFVVAGLALLWRCGTVDVDFGLPAQSQIWPLLGYSVCAVVLVVLAGVSALVSGVLAAVLAVVAAVCWFFAFSHNVTAACLMYATLENARDGLASRRGGRLTALGLGLIVVAVLCGIAVNVGSSLA
jgi:hypothetical protein